MTLSKGIAGIITGASNGIGQALAVKLAKDYQGQIVINARNEELLLNTKAKIEEYGGKAIAVVGDISNKGMAQKLAKTCLDEFGRIDFLVNNAGFARSGPVRELDVQDWRDVFEVNFFSALECMYSVLPQMIEQKSGKIVNVSSVAGKVAFSGSVCYSASKFALTGLSEGLAAELKRYGIDVITVCPGWVRTNFFKANNLSDHKNPTLIAERKDPLGFMMKNLLSISSEQAADEIVGAMKHKGSKEIILTGPGVAMERIKALSPDLAFTLASLVPNGEKADKQNADREAVKAAGSTEQADENNS